MDHAPDRSRQAIEYDQQKYYDSIAAVYDRHYHDSLATAYRTWLYDKAIGHIDLRNREALDAMCGGGENTAYLLGRGASVRAQDISNEQCEIYRKRYPGCPVERSSVLETGYPDASFDLVVVESLHHLHPHTGAAIREIGRILRPGGHILLWEPCSGSIADIARKIWYRLDRRYFLPNEGSVDLRKLLDGQEAAFEICSERYGGNFEFLFVFSSMHFRVPPKLVRWYARPCHALENLMNKLNWRLLACWMLVVLRKRG